MVEVIATSRNPQDPPETHGFIEGRTERLGETDAIEFAGQRIELRPLFEPALALATFIDKADNTVRTQRLAVEAANQRPISSSQIFSSPRLNAY